MLTAVTSVAEVRWFGSYRFAMAYDYESVDGQAVVDGQTKAGSATSLSSGERPVATVTPPCGLE